jgi:hypothetical protein
MSRTAVVAVALALLLAGCGQLGSLGSQPTETATAVELGERAGAQPGVGEADVDPDVLAGAHADALAATNYTVRVDQRTVGLDGRPLRNTRRYRTVARGGSSYQGLVRYNESVDALQEFGTIDYWRNESHVATRFDSPLRQVQVGIWQPTGSGPVSAPSNGPTLRTLLLATDPTVTQRFDDGTVELTGATEYPGATLDTPPRLTDVRNVSGRFRVRADGVITAWRLAYDATFGWETVRVVRTGTVEAVGATTVSRPAWVDDAVPLDDESEAITGPRSRSS